MFGPSAPLSHHKRRLWRIRLGEVSDQSLLLVCVHLGAFAHHPADRLRPLFAGLFRALDPVQVVANSAAFIQQRGAVTRGRSRYRRRRGRLRFGRLGLGRGRRASGELPGYDYEYDD